MSVLEGLLANLKGNVGPARGGLAQLGEDVNHPVADHDQPARLEEEVGRVLVQAHLAGPDLAHGSRAVPPQHEDSPVDQGQPALFEGGVVQVLGQAHLAGPDLAHGSRAVPPQHEDSPVLHRGSSKRLAVDHDQLVRLVGQTNAVQVIV